MTKRVLIAVACVLLAALILAVIPPATPVPDTQPSTGTTQPPVPTSSNTQDVTQPTLPSQPSQTTAPTAPPEPGVVRLYTCDPALEAVYISLAEEYYAQTGTEVIVLGPGEMSCADALAAYMATDNAPTIFCLHDQASVDTWQDKLYDLTGTTIAGQLYSQLFSLTAGDRLVAVAADVEGYGLICNTELLGTKAGFTLEDIQDYADLKMVVEHITSNKNRLEIGAFAPADFSDGSHGDLACLFAGMYPNEAQLRQFLDLYLGNTYTKLTPTEAFLDKKTVFYPGGTWDYDAVAELGGNNLGLLPVYDANGGAMHCVCTHYWAVSGTAKPQDIAVSTAFLGWLVTTDGKETPPIDRLGLLSPYKNATAVGNHLERQLRIYIASEPVEISWSRCPAIVELEEYRAALAAYLADPGDDAWSKVAELMQ